MSLPPSGVLSAGHVVTPDAVLSPGWIRLAGSRIDAIGRGEPPAEPGLPVTSLRGRWVLPGFVDMHVHGGGGASFTTCRGQVVRKPVVVWLTAERCDNSVTVQCSNRNKKAAN